MDNHDAEAKPLVPTGGQGPPNASADSAATHILRSWREPSPGRAGQRLASCSGKAVQADEDPDDRTPRPPKLLSRQWLASTPHGRGMGSRLAGSQRTASAASGQLSKLDGSHHAPMTCCCFGPQQELCTVSWDKTATISDDTGQRQYTLPKLHADGRAPSPRAPEPAIMHTSIIMVMVYTHVTAINLAVCAKCHDIINRS